MMNHKSGIDNSDGVNSDTPSWAVPQSTKLKYTLVFNSADKNRNGFLTGKEARNILLGTKLPQTILARVWNLADINTKGHLTRDEFVLAMYLCDLASSGGEIPSKLPANLIPPKCRRISRTETINQVNLSTSPSSMVTDSFEMRRRENYEKGQSELERRRRQVEELLGSNKKKEVHVDENIKEAFDKEFANNFRKDVISPLPEISTSEDDLLKAKEILREKEKAWNEENIARLKKEAIELRQSCDQLRSRDKTIAIDLQYLIDTTTSRSSKVAKAKEKINAIKVDIENIERAISRDRIGLSMENNTYKSEEKLTQVARERDYLQTLISQQHDKLRSIKERTTKLADEEKSHSLRAQKLLELKRQFFNSFEMCNAIYADYSKKRDLVSSMGATYPHIYDEIPNDDEIVRNNVTYTPENKAFTTSQSNAFSTLQNKVSLSHQNKDPFRLQTDAPFTSQSKDLFSRQYDTNSTLQNNATSTLQRNDPFSHQYDTISTLQNNAVNALSNNDPFAHQYDTISTPKNNALSSSTNKDPFSPQNKAPLSHQYDTISALQNNAASTLQNKDPFSHQYDAISTPQNNDLSSPSSKDPFSPKNNATFTHQNEDLHQYDTISTPQNTMLSSLQSKEPFAHQYIATSTPQNNAPSEPPSTSTAEINMPSTKQYRALYKFDARNDDEISLEPGDLVTVADNVHLEPGWLYGHLKGSKSGYFPESYVEQIVVNDASGSPADLTTHVVSQSPIYQLNLHSNAVRGFSEIIEEESETSDEPVTSLEDQNSESAVSNYQLAAVLAHYDANGAAGQISLMRGQLVLVEKKSSSGWWCGEIIVDGVREVGWFPASFVKIITPSLRSQLERKISACSSVSSGSCSKNEIKRQQHILELIDTEEAYVRDMSAAYQIYQKPLVESRILTVDQINQIFENWREIVVCNEMFLRALRVRRDMSADGVIRMIGDVLCEQMPNMGAYIRFCSCQLSAASAIQKLTETSLEFRLICARCQSDPRINGMPLSSHLLKPMQRVTKYPLLIKKILEYTEKSDADFKYLTQALAKAEEFCAQVNEGVRERENSERLEWLQQHVAWQACEPLIFNSLTNSIGPRKYIIHCCFLKKKSNKEIIAFLFNDMLLLTLSSKATNGCFSFDSKSDLILSVYKTPMLLNEIEIENSEGEGETQATSDVNLIYRVNPHQPSNSMILTLINSNEKCLWLKQFAKAKKALADAENTFKEISVAKSRASCGRVLVTVIKAVNLMRLPSSAPKSVERGVYCKVNVACQENFTPCALAIDGNEWKWNTSMQFQVCEVQADALCVTVLHKGQYEPDEFLGRTEIAISEILKAISEDQTTRPIVKTLVLREVQSGSVTVKLDLHLFENDK